MAASIISVESFELTGADPTPFDLTIPATTTAVYILWAYFRGNEGIGVDTCTLNSVTYDQLQQNQPPDTSSAIAGTMVWYSPSTGAQELDLSWAGNAPEEGPIFYAVYVKDGELTAWTHADDLSAQTTTAVSVTLTSSATDLVIKLDCKDGATPPSLSSGWSDVTGGTQTYNSDSGRLSTADSPGATTVCDCEDEDYSSICAVSIPAAAGGSIVPQIMHHRQTQMS